MKLIFFRAITFILISAVGILSSCFENNAMKDEPVFQYENFRDSLLNRRDSIPDSINLFDRGIFIPGVDSLDTLLISVDTVLARLKRLGSLSPAEKTAVIENMRMLDSFYSKKKDTLSDLCRENECELYAHVVKSKQLLFLYIDGELKDSFTVSTGKNQYTTPNISTRPQGPAIMKYTSRKFPGGNYQGLGNMPYAVFVKGGYAIHGTTAGNFSKLGQTASHGCIRLHPDNARVFYELVKVFSLNHTWVKVTDL